ncbi:MAG: hypothetical protein ACP5SH_25740, partial [Syntrophobacteraceae bacterium]
IAPLFVAGVQSTGGDQHDWHLRMQGACFPSAPSRQRVDYGSTLGNSVSTLAKHHRIARLFMNTQYRDRHGVKGNA